MNVLIVHAHPEPRSFCAALRDVAVAELEALGHDVLVSDLYADGFSAALSAADFLAPAAPDFLRPMEEQLHAVTTGTLAPDVAREVARLEEAALVIINAPMWWYSVPAVMKGWFDRVLVNGVAYGIDGMPPFAGPLRGKTALLVLTAANHAHEFTPERCGPLETVLHPIVHGTLRYTGMTTAEPFIAYGADSIDEAARRELLDAYRERLRALLG